MQAYPNLSPVPLPALSWGTFLRCGYAVAVAVVCVPCVIAQLATVFVPLRSLPQTMLFILNVLVGFWGMARVNIPLFLCLRRTTLAFVLAGEFFMLHKKFSTTTV